MNTLSTILIDLDGVLADFARGYSTTANDMYGTPVLGTETCPTWSVAEAVGLTREQDIHVWGAITRSEIFWRRLPELAGAEEFERIAALENVVFCTTRPSAARSQTRGWLREYGLYQPCIHVTDKAPLLCVFQHGGFALDDHVETIHNMCVYSTITRRNVWKPSLMTRQYNKDAGGLPRVDTLKEFLNACERG